MNVMQLLVYYGGAIVPEYSFDITDAGDTIRDEHGIDLADESDARDQAISLLPEIARDASPDGDDHEFVAKARNEADCPASIKVRLVLPHS